MLFANISLFANHIVGGELSFECLGASKFEFEVVLFRDNTGLSQGNDDLQVYLFVYDLDNQNANPQVLVSNQRVLSDVENNELGSNLINNVQPNHSRASYLFEPINLASNTNGYKIVYQRCCRTSNIVNLDLSSATLNTQGATYELLITPDILSACDSSENGIPPIKFTNAPGNQLCLGEFIIVDQSIQEEAFDFVDSVTYSICGLLDGADSNCPIVDGTAIGSCSAFPFNIDSAVYSSGYSALQPMGAMAVVNINSKNGLLLIRPFISGVYAYGVCAKSYKNGSVWTVSKRDFQIAVYDCTVLSDEPYYPDDGIPLRIDSLQIDSIDIRTAYRVCVDKPVDFLSDNTPSQHYLWDFGDPNSTTDTSSTANPSYTYEEEGKYITQLIANRNGNYLDTLYGYIETSQEGECRTATSLNINEFNSNTDFNVYPNPSTESVTIEINQPIERNAIIALYTLDGKLLLSQKVQEKVVKLDFPKQLSGSYILKLQLDGKVAAQRKIIVF